MKNNKLTLAAAAAAAIMAAPIFTPAISSFAANTTTTAKPVEQVINKIGQVKGIAKIYDKNGVEITETPLTDGTRVNLDTLLTINSKNFYKTKDGKYLLAANVSPTNEPAPNTNTNTGKDTETAASGKIVVSNVKGAALHDASGVETTEVFPVNQKLTYTAVAKIGGKDFYRVPGGYILKSDVTVVAVPVEKTPLKGTVKIAAGYTAVFNGQGKATTNLLKKGTTWKVFFKTVIGGKYFYNLGGDQYILASSAAYLPANQPIAMKAVGTVHYVPGYGIQIWTQDLGFVKDANGANKKLPHGTSWKVFARMNIQGKVYYNLGGDQWIDANYFSLR